MYNIFKLKMSNYFGSEDIKPEYDLCWKECKMEKNASPHKVKQQLKCDQCGTSHISKYDMKRHLDINLKHTRKTFARTDRYLYWPKKLYTFKM